MIRQIVMAAMLLLASFAVGLQAGAQPVPGAQLQADMAAYAQAEAEGDVGTAAILAQRLRDADFSALGFQPGESRDIRLSLAETLIEAGSPGAALELHDDVITDLQAEAEAADEPETRADLQAQLIQVLQARAELKSQQGDFAGATSDIERAHMLAVALYGDSSTQLIPILDQALNIDQAQGVENVAAEARLAELRQRAAQPALSTLGGDGPEAPDPGFETIRVFYASTRNLTGKDDPKRTFGNRRGELQFGSAIVTVPDNRTPGSLPRSGGLALPFWGERDDQHIILRRVDAAPGVEAFSESLSRSIAASETGLSEAFIYVHGHDNSFEGAALRTAQLAVDLDIQRGGIFYSWPTGNGALGYQTSQNNVDWAVDGLVALLEASAPQAERVHLIAHSMGNRILMQALDQLAERGFEVESKDGTPFDQVVWASPDVDADVFARDVEELRPLAAGMTLYASREDRPLWLSSWIGGDYPRAGQAPPLAQVAQAVTFVDTTGFVRETFDVFAHSDFAGGAINDLRAIVWFSLEPGSRCLLVSEQADEDTPFWRASGAMEGCADREFRRAISAMRRYGATAIEDVRYSVDEMTLDGTPPEQVGSWMIALAIMERLTRDEL